MNHISKRIPAVLLSFIVLLSGFSGFSVESQDDSALGQSLNGSITIPEQDIYLEPFALSTSTMPGSGTASSPYLISTEAQLRSIEIINEQEHYKLQNDITLTGGDWTPIDCHGVFDGNGHKIAGVRVSDYQSYAGFFGRNTGTIRYLGIVDADISASGNYGYAGVLAGSNSGTIQYCYSTGAAYGRSAGGLVGSNVGTVEHSYSHASAQYSHTAHVDMGAGGLIGIGSGYVDRCYATGAVSPYSSSYNNKGALTGGAHHPNTFLSFYKCSHTSHAGTDCTDLTESEAKNKASYYGWDFDNVWGISPGVNNGYPYLLPNAKQGHPYIEGDGKSPASAYLITNEIQLLAIVAGDFEDSYTSFYKLQNDIALTVDEWRPINTFHGWFDGNGHVISNVNVSGKYNVGAYLGFIGCNYGIIENLGISGTFVSYVLPIGALAGANMRSGIIRNCYSQGSVIHEANGGASGVGGLVGINTNENIASNNPTISNCYSTAEVFSPSGNNRVGGLVGDAVGGLIESSYAVGKVGSNTPSIQGRGGLIASLSQTNPPNTLSNYYDRQTTGQSDTNGATGLFSFEMKNQNSFAGWNFTETWGLSSDINNGYPYLRVFDKPEEQQQVLAPTANPPSGTVAIGTTVALATATADASIRYTTNGSTPTATSALYTAPIQITADTTIKAIAVKTGMINSAVSTFTFMIQQSDEVIEIEDPVIEQGIRWSLEKPTGEITKEDALSMKTITVYGNASPITSLKGLEHFTNLTTLWLSHGEIDDLTPLAALTKLTDLEVSDCSISNIEPIAGLTSLISLDLGNNKISSITPLSGLTNLRWLHLNNNKISDISPISSLLPGLNLLKLQNNNISDISIFAAKSPTTIDISYNNLDISSDSPTMQIINDMIEREPYGTVTYLPQNLTAAYTVTYDKNGGDTAASPGEQVVAAPATTVESLPTPPTRFAYTFTGWNTAPDGSGTVFTAETVVTENITVYAQWSIIPEYSPTFTVHSTSGTAGGLIEVVISISNNPGISSAQLLVSYDSTVLSVESKNSVQKGAALSSLTFLGVSDTTYNKNPISLSWSGTANDSTNGSIAVIRFKAADTALEGSYPITVQCVQESTVNQNNTPVTFTIENGIVMLSKGAGVTSYTLNDLKGGVTWDIPAGDTKDSTLNLGTWYIANIFTDSDFDNSSLSGAIGESSITVKHNAKPFKAIVKLIDDNQRRLFIGIEKPVSVTPGTVFEDYFWTIPAAHEGKAVLEIIDWQIVDLYTKNYNGISQWTDSNITVSSDSSAFSCVVKITNAKGEIKFIGIERK